jgi:hypothetical protein
VTGGANESDASDFSYPERGYHLALFLTVYEIIMVLHRNEGREAIVDRVIFSEKMDRRVNQLLNREGR